MSFSRRCPGLELLPCVIYEMVKQSLGNKSIKCVVDDDNDCIFTSDMEVLLSSLMIEHPAGELIYHALKSHKDQFGEGIRTYMFMITRIAKAVSQLEDLGIRKAASLAVIQEVIDELTRQVHQISISMKPSSSNEIKHEVKPTHPSNHSSPQMDDFKESNIIAIKPVDGSTSEDSFNPTTIFSEKPSSHNAPIVFTDDLDRICSADGRNSKKSSSDLPIKSRSSDCDWLLGSSLREGAKLQPLDEKNSFINCNLAAAQTHELPKPVINERLVAGIVMECDPVRLKMSDLYPKDENEDDDIDWFFDDNFVKDEVEKPVHQKSMSSAKLEAEKAANYTNDLSDSNTSESSFSTDGCQDDAFLHKNAVEKNIYLEDRRHPNLTNGDNHDSDFEDCFDDLENRKQVVVVVERVEDSFSNTLPLCQDRSIMNSRMAHNIQKHFAPVEFDSVSDVPSLNDCLCDKGFSDCFDSAMSCDSQGKLVHGSSHKTQDISEPETNQSGLALKQRKSVLHLKSPERSTSTPPEVTSYDGTTFPSPTSYKHTSELDNLNSILSSINARKSQNVKEILVSSRHKVDEMYFKEFNDKVDTKTSDNSEGSYWDYKSDAIEQSESPSLKVLNQQTESNASIELSNSVNRDIISQPLQKTNAIPESAANTTKTISSSTPSACKSRIEKLNSILSSVNVKKSHPETRQILLSSRHGLKEDDLTQNCPSPQVASNDVTDLEKPKSSPENSTSCTFKKSTVNTHTDHEQHKEALDKSTVESCMQNRFDWETMTLTIHRPDACVSINDVVLNTRRFFTLPVDLPFLTRGHEDVVELIERLYSSTTDFPTDKGKNILNHHLTHCISIQSPRSSRAVVEGLITPCGSHDMDNLRKKFGCPLNALLINGDLIPGHRHKGYKPIIAKKNLIKSPADIASQGKEVLWASRIVDNMKQLNVSAVFIRGNTTSIMSDVCLSAGIVPLTNTSFHALRIISQQMKVDMLCYAEDASKSNVCQLFLEPLNPSWMDVTEDNHCLLVSNVNHVKSVVLSEPCALAAQISEEKFWKSFHRVSNAISDGMVLPGGGMTEFWCMEQIKRMTSSLTDFRKSDEHLLKVTILENLADVFQDFADTVKHNAGTDLKHQGLHSIPNSDTCKSTCKGDSVSTDHHLSLLRNEALRQSISCQGDSNNHPQIPNTEAMQKSIEPNSIYENIDTHFDTFGSKISAWRSAVDVVSVINSLDCLIITGASEKDLDYDGILL